MIDLILDDCMNVMKDYEDNHFDLAIVDPPYGINYDGAKKSSGSHGGRKAHRFKGWDNKIPSKKYFEELKEFQKIRLFGVQII